jgi:phage gpG-like protein
VKIIVIHPDDEDAVVQLIGRLRDKDALLDAVGALLVRTSQRAFAEQRLGDVIWPERYEGGPEPFVNVAGLIADFNAGKTKPPNRRFDRRPALFDTGGLARSVSYRRVGADTVEAGSTEPHAGIHQQGGETTQPVTAETKSRLWKWLKGRRTGLARKRKKLGQRDFTKTASEQAAASGAAEQAESGHKALMRRLGWLMNKNTHELATKVHRRPFVGITDSDADEIRELVESHVAGEGI